MSTKQHCVYLLDIKIKSEFGGFNVYKVGMSANVNKRINSFTNTKYSKPGGIERIKKIESIKCLRRIKCNSEQEAYALEQQLLTRHKHNKWEGAKLLPNGNTELLLANTTILLDFNMHPQCY